MSSQTDFPRASMPPARRFQGVILFADGKMTPPFIIEARAASGACAKLAGLISDQPVRVLGFTIKDVTEEKTILAAPASALGRLKANGGG